MLLRGNKRMWRQEATEKSDTVRIPTKGKKNEKN